MARASLGKHAAAGDLAVLRMPRRLSSASPGRCALSEALLERSTVKRQTLPEGIGRLRLPKGLPSGQCFSSSAATSARSAINAASSASTSARPSSRSASNAASEADSVRLPEIGGAARLDAPEAPAGGGARRQHRRFTASELDRQLEELLRSEGRAPTVGVLEPMAAARPAGGGAVVLAGFRRDHDGEEEERELAEWEGFVMEEASRFAKMSQIQAELEDSTWQQTSGQVAARVRADQNRVAEKIRRLSLLTGELGVRTTLSSRSERRRTRDGLPLT